MDLRARRDIGIDSAQEREELFAAMLALKFTDDVAYGHIQRRKRRRGSMAHVVVRAPFGKARRKRQQRLRAIQSLNLALFVNTQHAIDVTVRSRLLFCTLFRYSDPINLDEDWK